MRLPHFSTTWKLTAGLFASLALATPASAQLSGVSILNITGITESSLTDGNMAQARGVLTGAGASITDVAIGSFSASNLLGIDVLYVGLVNNGFTDGQVTTIGDYVRGGGGIVAVGTERACCFGPSWEEIINELGFSGLGGDREENALPTDPTSPIVDGPFGVATDYEPSATGAFNPGSLPPGTNVVWEGVDGNPIIVTLDTGGRAFFFADTNFMEDPYIGDGHNRTIWGNAFAFTGRVDGAVPEPGTWAMLMIGFAGLGAAMRRSKRKSIMAFS